MRIVAGELKGRVIASPSESTTRPTTDRVRESIFSSVYSRLPELDEVRVLDAFAGSGALGIEAISRGAKECVFFERDHAARRVLESNLKSLGLGAGRAQIRPLDVFECAQLGGPFKLVLLDPPYACDAGEVRGLLYRAAQSGELDEACVVVYEHAIANKQEVADAFADDAAFALTGQKKYGKIGVSYFRYSGCED